jgi:biotin-dependent carboxylase-like uncharacterized protein
MDRYSASVANSLLENEKTAAVLEITMTGPTIVFQAPTYIAITGAEMKAKINGDPLDNNRVHKIEKDDELTFGTLVHGLRTYLAVKDGFLTEEVLGSRSMYFPITKLNRLKDSMELPYDECLEFEPKISHIKPDTSYKELELKVFQGPEYDMLNDLQKQLLFNTHFKIAKENNRMAYQLDQLLEPHAVTMLTSATLPGTVQLTPAGKIIILMRDGQTTGGYPRILHLSNKSISLLAQKKFGEELAFKF